MYTVSARNVHAVKDPAISGYAHAFVTVKPWKVYVDGRLLVDGRKRPRRYSTEAAALAAGQRQH